MTSLPREPPSDAPARARRVLVVEDDRKPVDIDDLRRFLARVA